MAKGTNKKKKKVGRWIALGLVAIIIIIIISQCGKESEKTVLVTTSKAVMGDVSSILETSGTLASEDVKMYTSPISAKIAEVNAKVGQPIKNGEYLITYDTTSLEENYTLAELQAKSQEASNADTLNRSNQNQQEANDAANNISALNGQIDALKTEVSNLQSELTQKQSELSEANAELTTYQEQIATASEATPAKDLKGWQKSVQTLSETIPALSATLASLQTQLEEKSADLGSKQAELATNEAKKEAAESAIMSSNAKASLNYNSQATSLSVTNAADSLEKAKAGITAEFDGIVVSVDTMSGSAAMVGQSLVTVANSGAMKVDFQVSKYNLTELEVGQPVIINVLNQDYKGTISSISKLATIDIGSGASAAMVSAEVHIDNPDDKLIIGIDAKLAIQLGKATDVILVPVAAVNTATEGDFVYVVEDSIVKKKAVTVGIYGKEQVEIKEGLTVDEHVISTVDSNIKEGITVIENLNED